MVQRVSTHLMLRPEDVEPRHDRWEVIGTFNPGVVRYGEEIVLLVRVAERPKEKRPGWTALPRWSSDGGTTIDWVRDEEVELLDPRVARLRTDGRIRLTFLSHLRVAISHDGRTIDRVESNGIMPACLNEEFGVEDPRITYLEDRYYITYVAVSRHGPATALASTADFKTFDRHGVIFCPENKDVVLFPERISGQYVALHRPVCGTQFSPPQMWIARSDDLIHWGQHDYLFGGQNAWETGRVGAGAPPLATPGGWLEVYHGNRRPSQQQVVGAYCGGAILLAKDAPDRILGIGREPILRPELDFERQGFVANVVFPTGVLAEGDLLLIFYGASDTYSAVAQLKLSEVMQTIE